MTYWDTNTATVWDVTSDEYGQPTYSEPRAIDVVWRDGVELSVDENGKEFVPEQEFFTLEALTRGQVILSGDFTGDSSSPFTLGAREIRRVTAYDQSQFNAPTEYKAQT